MHLAHELSIARLAANRAAEQILAIYQTDFSVEWKGRGDPVTQADRKAQEAITLTLAEAFPDDYLCAEESTAEQAIEAASQGGRCWFVDPLDGTREFVDRNGEFCVMIGLAIEGVPVLGVVHIPAQKRTLWGVTSEACAWQQRNDGTVHPVRVPAPAQEPSRLQAVASRSHSHPQVAHLFDKLGITRIRKVGSVGIKASLVAAGEADLYAHAGGGPKLWDGCAPDAIARAAGARFTNGLGKDIGYATNKLALDQGILVAAPSLHEKLVHHFS